jgi:hypothetical protein
MASIHNGRVVGSGLQPWMKGRALKRVVLIVNGAPLHVTEVVEASSPQA